VGSYSAAGASAATPVAGFTVAGPFDLTAIGFDPTTQQPVLLNNATQHNVLQFTENGITYGLQLNPSESFAGDFFQLSSLDGGTEITEVSTPCYCLGTLIRTPRGERRVETFEIGDEVMTASGVAQPIKWIGRRSYAGRFVLGRKDILPVCIKADALGANVPKRDLWNSPHHAMYFDEDGGVLIEAKDLVNGFSIVQAEHVDTVEYFHIELDTHDVIIAESALAETFIDDGSRAMFHNAYDYSVLYPDAQPASSQYCAPRLDDGYEVEAARRRIALRADLRPADAPCAGPLRGFVDYVGARLIEGWAQNVEHPEAPVCLDIYVGERLLGQVLANAYRADLARAGIGGGFHSFRFTPPDGVAFAPDAVEVRRSLDEVVLPVSKQARRIDLSTVAWGHRRY